MKTEFKLFIATMLTGLALVLGVLAYQYYDLEHYQKRRLLQDKSFFSRALSDLTIREFASADKAGFERLCGSLYQRGEMVYLAMIAPDNKEVLYLCTDKDRAAILSQREKFAKGGLQGEVKIIGIPAVPVRNWVFSPRGKKLGALEVAYSWQPLYDEFARRAKTFFFFFLGLSAVLGAVLVLRARALLGPLERFASNLKKIEAEWPLPQEEFNARLETAKAGPEIKPVLEVLKASLVKLLEHQEALRKSEELASLGKLSAQVAHDIRSPLAALGAAAKGLDISEDQRTLIDGAVGRMQGIADDLLQRYRAPGSTAVSKAGTHSLAGLIEQVLAEKRLQHKDKPSVKIEFAASAEGIQASVDAKELQRIISNLVNNSVEAFSGHGAVRVVLSGTDGKVLIEIKDDGKGIPPEILAKLGQKGETHGKAGGTGLGLYHARTSVESWGGALAIKSEHGRGTTVSITLPAAAKPAAGLRAVLLDDDALVHMNWRLAAKAAGAELLSFKTPQELAAAAETLPRDIPIYLDYELGDGVKGEDIAKDLHERGFTDITMATGHGAGKFAQLPWLKAAGKEPPWA